MASNDEKVFYRVERALSEQLAKALYRDSAAVEIAAWAVHDEPVPFSVAREAEYQVFHVGDQWGSPWDTWWLRVDGEVPQTWSKAEQCEPELVVRLTENSSTAIGFQAEGLVYDSEGRIVKAVEPMNSWVPVPKPGHGFRYYIEAAANPDINQDAGSFAPTTLGSRDSKNMPELYRLSTLELRLRDIEVWHLIQELKVLSGLARELDGDRTRHADIMMALERSMETLDPSNIAGTAVDARACLAPVLSDPASDRAHIVHAVGQAHIDTAWLWPFRETKRKVARTFSNVVDLQHRGDKFVFAASSAQQYQWLKQKYPDLFARVKEMIAKGTFIPIGGMWVECDANLPSGESLTRQFLYGTKFFRHEFGELQPVAWLPDSFGYSATLPQIVRLAGNRYFLTQKISWNDTNRFPHNTFLWRGIDGTEVFTHFPPSDTYSAEMTPEEIAIGERHYSEKGKGRSSLMLFGWGDGGGGPTREMLEAIRLQSNLAGSPKITMSTPIEFFEQAESELEEPPVWEGELYLELHRGTYTTQKHMKMGNRRNESLLRAAEMWATTASVRTRYEYPYRQIEELWQQLLLLQFHDVLPGSSIAWVHEQSAQMHERISEETRTIIDEAIRSLVGEGTHQFYANAGPFEQLGVPAGSIKASGACASVVPEKTDEGFVFSNGRVRYVVDDRGRIVSAVDNVTGRESIDPASPANVLQLFVDFPAQWDAWDIDRSYLESPLAPAVVRTVDLEDNVLIVKGIIGNSSYTQRIWLDPDVSSLVVRTAVEWKESNRLLKLAFPSNVRSSTADSEIQYGHLTRPITENTTWDEARFETSAQRWVHVGEFGFGITVANDGSYGHDIRQIRLSDGGIGTQIRVSLLRSTHYPDPQTDVGDHVLTVSFSVGSTISEAIRQGYRLNVPSLPVCGDHEVLPLISLDGSGVIVEAVKLAEDESGDVVVRLYESLGGRSKARLHMDFEWSEVREVGLLEEECDAVRPALVNVDATASDIELELRPYQIVTLRFKR